VSGNPPAAAQIKGPSIQEWAKEGSLGSIGDAAKEWDKLLPKAVADIMKYKGNYVAAPVNVHRVNWLWINQDALNKAGGKAPTTYDEFFALADKFKAQGLVAIAHGGQPWQDATVFESVVLGVGGAKFYNDALVKLDPTAINSPTMLKSFDTLTKIKTYIDKDASGRDWNLATAMIMNGKGGMQFMGDWAKGEFTAANKVSGKDYACVAAPGTANAYTFNVDSFAMFNLKAADAKKGQLDLATAIMSPEFQEVFNLNKGSIPVRPGVNKSKFDACATKSMADFDATAHTGGLVASFAHGMALPSAKQGAIVDVIAKFMNSTMSSKDAVAALVKASKTK
jgi:glucose/mannose transport system substrate-binding protein